MLVGNMKIFNICKYYKKYGLIGFIRRIVARVCHIVYPKADVMYYVDLIGIEQCDIHTISPYEIVSRKSINEIQHDELESLYENIDQSLLQPQLYDRFSRGAVLWLIKKDHCTAGKIWTLTGFTVEPYYYFVTPSDVHLFNNYIFKAYRGQGINPILIQSVLSRLKSYGIHRAFIETNLRNISERKSLAKTSFIPVGVAMKMRLLRWRMTLWRSVVPKY
jgi:GNAT superfamily N-acetyltransferase